MDLQRGIDALPPRLGDRLKWRLFTRRQHRQEVRDRAFDQRYGTETAGDIPLEALGVSAGDAARGNNVYRPVWPEVFHEAMRQLQIRHAEFVLVDYGSGKGKLLFLAAAYPFAGIVGVEYAEELHRITEANIAKYRQSVSGCPEIVSIHGDALDYDPPALPLVCTFFNPFDDQTFAGVVERLERSFAAHPRPIYLVFLHVRTLRERPGVVRILAASKIFREYHRSTRTLIVAAAP